MEVLAWIFVAFSIATFVAWAIFASKCIAVRFADLREQRLYRLSNSSVPQHDNSNIEQRYRRAGHG